MENLLPLLLLLPGLGTAVALRLIGSIEVTVRSRDFLQISVCSYGFYLVLFLYLSMQSSPAGEPASWWSVYRPPVYETIMILLVWSGLSVPIARLKAPDWLAAVGVLVTVVSLHWLGNSHTV